jgi:molecular chaperone HtpG
VPPWLRFLRGVVDSEDVPLNISRETLQEDKNLAQIQAQLTKSVLRTLKELSESDADRYKTFWSEFGRVLKEGVAVDWKHKDDIAELCRFESLMSKPGTLTSLRKYVDAMPSDQREIYYLTAPTRRSAEEGPHLEALKRHGFDVLLLTDPVDEWVVQSLKEFDKRRLKSAAHGDVDLGDEADKKAEENLAPAVAAVKAALGERVKDVRFSRRLTDSASCLVAEEGDPGANMQRLMKILDAAAEEPPRILELNPTHPIIQNLSALAAKDPAAERVKEWSELLYDQALLAEGVVKEPAVLVKRIQRLLTEVTSGAVAKEPR